MLFEAGRKNRGTNMEEANSPSEKFSTAKASKGKQEGQRCSDSEQCWNADFD